MMVNENIRDRVLRALYNDPTLITCMKEKYINDDLWRYCIEREPSVFAEMKHPSKELCEFAVEVDGNNLKIIREKFDDIPITERMCYVAVKNCPRAILYVPPRILKGNYALQEMAFDQDPSLMVYFDDIRPEYIEKKVKENPTYLKYISNPDEDLVCEMLIKHPNICVYFDKLTPRMVETLRTYHPDVYELYSRLYDLS